MPCDGICSCCGIFAVSRGVASIEPSRCNCLSSTPAASLMCHNTSSPKTAVGVTVADKTPGPPAAALASADSSPASPIVLVCRRNMMTRMTFSGHDPNTVRNKLATEYRSIVRRVAAALSQAKFKFIDNIHTGTHTRAPASAAFATERSPTITRTEQSIDSKRGTAVSRHSSFVEFHVHSHTHTRPVANRRPLLGDKWKCFISRERVSVE